MALTFRGAIPPGGLFIPEETGFASYHPGGCHFLFSDGGASFVIESIDQKVLAALTTRAGGGRRNRKYAIEAAGE